MQEGITIYDVARLANVSPSTVSNWLNGRQERMRPETRKRIEKTINQLGYAPSRIARQLKTGHVPIIGLIVPSVANPFWGGVAHHMEAAARKHNYHVLLGNTERDPRREQHYAEALWAQGIRRIMFGSSPLSFDYVVDLVARGLRVVAFDRQTQFSDMLAIDSVSVDNIAGTRLAIEHLLALGHRRIGFISGPIRTVSRIDRLEGYRSALIAAGIMPLPELIWSGASASAFGDSEGIELGRQGACELLSHDHPPTALFAINDLYAMGAYTGVRDLNMRVPDDVSIVGFDDTILAEAIDPALTTVHQPLAGMMSALVELLINQLDRTSANQPQHLVFAPDLMIRGSTTAPHTP